MLLVSGVAGSSNSGVSITTSTTDVGASDATTTTADGGGSSNSLLPVEADNVAANNVAAVTAATIASNTGDGPTGSSDGQQVVSQDSALLITDPAATASATASGVAGADAETTSVDAQNGDATGAVVEPPAKRVKAADA